MNFCARSGPAAWESCFWLVRMALLVFKSLLLSSAYCLLSQGVCANAIARCAGTDGWQDCTAEDYGADYEEQEQSCDGLDNDCDGLVDNIAPDFAPLCPLSQGVCATARQECAGEAGWKSCTSANYGDRYQAEELACDGLDNDCDGETDEGVDCPPCQGNSDCGDENSCTDDVCLNGFCRFQRRDAGSICNDGEFCRTNDRCDETGYCSGVLESPCTQICNSVCNEQTDHCDPDPAGTDCPNNDNYCDGVEACNGFGQCTSPGNPCSENDCQHCHEDTDSCIDPEGSTCTDDGLFCNGSESCDDAGHCISSGNPCPESECQHCQEIDDNCLDPAESPCTDDGLYCNGDEQCDGAGHCTVHTGNPCAPESQCRICQEDLDNCFDSESTPCDDGDNCQTGDHCNGNGACIPGEVLKDSDNDSHIDQACGGDDCDDEDDTIPAVEGPVCDSLATCFDGKDNDCNGDTDLDDSACDSSGYFCLYGPESGQVSLVSGSQVHVYLDPDINDSEPVNPERIICFSEAERQISPTVIHQTDFQQAGAWTIEGPDFVNFYSNPNFAELSGNVSLISPPFDSRDFERLLLRVTMSNEGLDYGEFVYLAFRSNTNPSWTYLNLAGNGRVLNQQVSYAQFLPNEALDQSNLQIGFVQTGTSSLHDDSRVWYFELVGLPTPTQYFLFQQNRFESIEGNASSSCSADILVGFSEDTDDNVCLEPAAQNPQSPGTYGVRIQSANSISSALAPVGWIPQGTLLELRVAYGLDSAVSDDYARMFWSLDDGTGLLPLSPAIQGQGYNMHNDVLNLPQNLNLQTQAFVKITGPANGGQANDFAYGDDYALFWSQASHDLVGPFTPDSQRTDLFNATISSDLISSTHVHCVYLDENGPEPVLQTDGQGGSGYPWGLDSSVPLPLEFVR